MTKIKNKEILELAKLLSLVTHIGVTIVLSIGIPLIFAIWVENHYDLHGILIIFSVFVGIFVAIRNVYEIIKEVLTLYDK